MAELITRELAKEYQAKAMALGYCEDVGEHRRLRIELQMRCGLTELDAVNLLNDRNTHDIIEKYKWREIIDANRNKNSDGVEQLRILRKVEQAAICEIHTKHIDEDEQTERETHEIRAQHFGSLFHKIPSLCGK